jgi:hypothetical protein
MSDIADSGSFDLGLAQLAANQSGPNAITQQANTAANNSLTQQQTQGEAIKNANARLQYQLFRQGMAHLTDFSGQGGPTLGASAGDSSGVTAASAQPGAGAPPTGASGVSPEDDIGQSAADQARLQAAIEQKYNVDPAGTQDEQRAIIQAHQYAVQMKLSGNKGLADAAEERVQMLKDQRDMNVTSRKNAAALDASEHYDKLAAAESAPEGQALATLQAVMPVTAKNLEKAHADATPEQLDEATRDTAGHMASFLHRFTNREVVVGDDGATYDKQSGMRVDVPIRGVSPERQAALLEQANKIITTKNSDGSETTEPQYKRDGYQNPGQWVTDVVAQIRARNGANNVVEAVGNHAAQYGHVTPGAPPVPGGTLYRGPQPNAGQLGAQPGAAGQQPQTAPAQPPPGDPQVLRQALTDQEYKLKTPPVIPGRSQTPGDAEQQKANVTARQTLLKDSSDLTSTSSQAKAYTDAALAVLNNPDKPPTGLSAPAKVAISRAMQALGMTSGDWATRSQELAKYMGNLAVQNFKANFGARPAAKEFDIQMTELNPNNKMTPDAIRDLLQSNARIAKYGIDSGRRAGLYVNQGGDPNRFSEWNERYFPRSDSVNAQTTPPTRPGQSTSGQSSGAAAPETRTYQGKTYVLTPGAPRNNPNSWKAQ